MRVGIFDRARVHVASSAPRRESRLKNAFPETMPRARAVPRRAWLLALLALLAAPPCDAHSRIFQITRPNADHSSLEVVEGGLRRLEQLGDRRVSLVSVVGGFHTGKSFLCNVLNASTSGFELGPTHESTTMGLWLGETGMISEVDGSEILLVDTEGFSAAGVAEAYDAQVFALATLLSSHLLYNSVKLITAAEVEYLEILARRARLWSLRADLEDERREDEREDDDASEAEAESEAESPPPPPPTTTIPPPTFPPLTWVVEDFFQDLGDTTPTEWLLSFVGDGGVDDAGAMTQPPGRRPLVDGNYTLARLFGGGDDVDAAAAAPRRVNAHTLFLPASSRIALRSLHTVPYAELEPEFLEQVDALREDVLRNAEAKLPPRALAALLRALVKSVNAGNFPSLPTLWSSWEGQLLSQARDAAVDLYVAAAEVALRGDVGAAASPPPPPLAPEAFRSRLAKAKDDAEDLFKASLFGLEPLWRSPLESLRRELTLREAKDVEINDAAVERQLDAAVADAFEAVESEIDAIVVPQPPAELKRIASARVGEVEKQLAMRIAMYAKSANGAHARTMQRFRSFSAVRVVAARVKNDDAEAEILAAADAASKRRYDLDMTASTIRASADKATTRVASVDGPGALPMAALDIRSLHAAAKRAGLDAFDDAVLGRREDGDDAPTASPTASLLKSPNAAMHRSHAERELEIRGHEWTRRNEAAAAKLASDALEHATNAVEAETDRLPLPDLAASLREKIERIARRHVDEFNAKTSPVADTAAAQDALIELKKTNAERLASSLEQNARQWHKALAPVSEAALETLNFDRTCAIRAAWSVTDAKLNADAVRRCAREIIPWALKRDAANAWIDAFEHRRAEIIAEHSRSSLLRKRPRNVMIVNMTSATVREVAKVFVNDDVSERLAAARVKFRCVLLTTLCVVVASAWLHVTSKPRHRRVDVSDNDVTDEDVDDAFVPDVDADAPGSDRAWVTIDREEAAAAEAAAAAAADAERVVAADADITPPRAKTPTPPHLVDLTGGDANLPNPVVFNATQPLPDEDAGEERFDLVDGTESDSPGWAEISPPRSPTPPPPLQMTVSDIMMEINRVRDGDADAMARVLAFHVHPDVRHLVSAAETHSMGGADARTVAEWHVRVLGYVRLRTDDDEEAWLRAPYVTSVLRRYADRV